MTENHSLPSARPVHPDAVMESSAWWAPWQEIVLNVVLMAAGATLHWLAFERFAWPLGLTIPVYGAVFVAWLVALHFVRRRAAWQVRR